jgi:hypothetical protein
MVESLDARAHKTRDYRHNLIIVEVVPFLSTSRIFAGDSRSPTTNQHTRTEKATETSSTSKHTTTRKKES